jgi:tetratricopeptide (TPR) repeat protein
MDDRLYRFLKLTAIVLAVAWVGWSIYDSFFVGRTPGEMAYHAANNFFQDGNYARALEEYDAALREDPQNVYALRGRGRSLMQLGRDNEALAAFDEAIAREPEFAATYANRGILYDRMGKYRQAIVDYEKALQLDSKLAEGPDWLTRFLRLQPDKPPSIEDRARYLRAELAKPESERVLRMPEEDNKQRPYKL